MDENIREFLKRLRNSAQREFIPIMREKTSELLEKTVKELRPNECLEIGTCLGVSGITVLAAGGKRLTTMEIDGDIIGTAEENFRKCGLRDRVTFLQGDCFETLNFVKDNRYDLIILDGPKGHYAELYKLIKPMLNCGGIIFADDIAFHGLTDGEEYPKHKHRTIVRGMREFIETVKNDAGMKAEFYDIEDGACVIKKVNKK